MKRKKHPTKFIVLISVLVALGIALYQEGSLPGNPGNPENHAFDLPESSTAAPLSEDAMDPP